MDALENKIRLHQRLVSHLPIQSDFGLAIPGIGSVSVYDDYKTGHFEHIDQIDLFWRAPDWFEFIPPSERFTFKRENGEIITPSQMFTDGGSIPRPFWTVRGLSPWGYLPAFILHDWEFDAHHNHIENRTFEDVRDTMMEAVKTLMETNVCPKSETIFNVLYIGINSSIARDVWNTGIPGPTLPG